MRTFAALMVLLLLATASITRNAEWQDDVTIWSGTIKAFPRRARAYNEVGLYLLNTGKYEEAYRYLSRSLELDPYQQQIWNNLAQVYEHMGQTGKAIEIYERAIGNAPDDATPYYNLGVLYLDRQKDTGKASMYLLRARDLDPLEPDIHFQLNRLYTQLGDPRKAQEELDRFNYLKR